MDNPNPFGEGKGVRQLKSANKLIVDEAGWWTKNKLARKKEQELYLFLFAMQPLKALLSIQRYWMKGYRIL